MDMPVGKVQSVRRVAQQPISLETPIGEEEDSHLGDFIETRPPRYRFIEFASRYALFVSLIATSIALHLLMLLRVWEYDSCDELPDALFWECMVYPSPVLTILWIAAMVLALALGVFKIGYSVWSLLRKLRLSYNLGGVA